MANTVHWSLLNHPVRLQTSWYHKAFFQHSRAAWVRAECRGRECPLSGARDPELFIAWEQYTHFLGLLKKKILTILTTVRGTELSKSNHEHTHTQTRYPLHTNACMKKNSCTLCPVLNCRTHLSYGLKWVKIRTVDGRSARAPQCRVTERTHTNSPLREKLNTHALRKLIIRIIKAESNIHASIIDWKRRYSELFTTTAKEKSSLPHSKE